MRKATILVVVAGALTIAVALLAQSQESIFGTWKMNAAKSKFTPGPLPKSSIAKWEAYQGGLKLTLDQEPAKGATQHWEVSGKFDGKDNPVTGNNPDADTMAFSKIDDHTYQVAQKKGGKPTLTSRIVVAKDGKTRVTTQTGTNGKGETVAITMFYEKQ